MKSLKGTLFRGVIVGIVPVLLIAGCVLYFSVRAQLLNRMDESLADKVRMLSLSVEEKPFGLEVDVQEMGTEEMKKASSPEYIYIGTLDGRVIYRSASLQGLPIPSFSEVPNETRSWSVLPDGRALRTVLYSFYPEMDDEEDLPADLQSVPGLVIERNTAPGERIVFQLFRDAASHNHFMNIFLFMLTATGLGALGVLSLTVWLAIKRGSDPINQLASGIEKIGEKDLAIRLEEGSMMKELVPIIQTFNLFMDRLEESFDRERGFTSDAAHELRTPLAGLRTTIEVSLARERESREYRAVLERTLEIVLQLENLVNSLLRLARLEAGQESGNNIRINLVNFVEELWAPFGSETKTKGIDVFIDLGNDDFEIGLDADMLGQVLEELFRNAVYYTQPGGRIEMVLSRLEGNTTLRVINSGSRVSCEETGNVFDRFWRGRGSRDDTGIRFGLGLPIVKKIVQTMGWTITVESENEGEFTVILCIPLENTRNKKPVLTPGVDFQGAGRSAL